MAFKAPNHCPYCNHKFTHAGGQDHPPEPDDYSVCIRCAKPAIFDHDLKLRKPNEAELVAMAMDDDLEDMIQRVRYANHVRIIGP